ncbi:MAG TPA: L-lactate permease, partial [Acetobacteraceae bacterium]|nr:L-lactate permease [Acetobacteraceae bacterium]
ARILGHGGIPIGAVEIAREGTRDHGLATSDVLLAWMPFAVLVVVVAAWTGPWSSLPGVGWFAAAVTATAPETKSTITAAFKFAPWVGGSAILASWLIISVLLSMAGKLKAAQVGAVFSKTFHQMWGALLVGFFIFGLAFVFNYSGMASSLAKGFSYLGTWFIIVAPLLGFIGVALSGSNTSTNAMFGKFQALVGVQLGFPPLLLPTLNSVGSEIGKPIAPQTASVGVSTSKFVRAEGEVIRHNFGWTLVLLAYLVVLGVVFYFVDPAALHLR